MDREATAPPPVVPGEENNNNQAAPAEKNDQDQEQQQQQQNEHDPQAETARPGPLNSEAVGAVEGGSGSGLVISTSLSGLSKDGPASEESAAEFYDSPAHQPIYGLKKEASKGFAPSAAASGVFNPPSAPESPIAPAPSREKVLFLVTMARTKKKKFCWMPNDVSFAWLLAALQADDNSDILHVAKDQRISTRAHPAQLEMSTGEDGKKFIALTIFQPDIATNEPKKGREDLSKTQLTLFAEDPKFGEKTVMLAMHTPFRNVMKALHLNGNLRKDGIAASDAVALDLDSTPALLNMKRGSAVRMEFEPAVPGTDGIDEDGKEIQPVEGEGEKEAEGITNRIPITVVEGVSVTDMTEDIAPPSAVAASEGGCCCVVQ